MEQSTHPESGRSIGVPEDVHLGARFGRGGAQRRHRAHDVLRPLRGYGSGRCDVLGARERRRRQLELDLGQRHVLRRSIGPRGVVQIRVRGRREGVPHLAPVEADVEAPQAIGLVRRRQVRSRVVECVRRQREPLQGFARVVPPPPRRRARGRQIRRGALVLALPEQERRRARGAGTVRIPDLALVPVVKPRNSRCRPS